MNAMTTYRTLSDAQVATIFEASNVPIEEDSIKQLKYEIMVVSVLEAIPDIDRYQTIADNLRRTAGDIRATALLVVIAFQTLERMMESDLMVRIPEQWLVGGVPKFAVNTSFVSDTFRDDYHRYWAWTAAMRSQPDLEPENGPPHVMVQRARSCSGLEALGVLLSEMAKEIEFWLAFWKSNGGPRREWDKDVLITRLRKFWTQRLGRRATGTPGGPFAGFVNAVFKELGWGENNERRVQKILRSLRDPGS
jgi:hypothetical protein